MGRTLKEGKIRHFPSSEGIHLLKLKRHATFRRYPPSEVKKVSTFFRRREGKKACKMGRRYTDTLKEGKGR